VFPLELVITGTVVDGEPLFIAIGQDVTERKEVERSRTSSSPSSGTSCARR
jgi:hypothetical protein